MWITFVDKKTNKDIYINKKQIAEVIITSNDKEKLYDVELITSNGNRYSILEYKSDNKDLEAYVKSYVVQRIYDMMLDDDVRDIDEEFEEAEYFCKQNNY